MTKPSFDLISNPWIKVIDKENQLQKVSLNTLFMNAQHYRQLAGEMKSQDLAILRFLIAILTTVYSRFNANGESYDGVELDKKFRVISGNTNDDEDDFDDDSDDDNFVNQEALLDTWSNLYHAGHFSNIVCEYLEKYKEYFNMFGETPFYQVSAEMYDSLVLPKKRISTGSGTIAIKQIDRTISESANTPNIFTPKSDYYKNQIKIDELARWIITYQNFTGVTDKTKVYSSEKFSVSAGWLYGLNPVFAQGKDLFETLMLNLAFLKKEQGKIELSPKKLPPQKPVWEWNSIYDYINHRLKADLPDNLSEIYTMWSRILHIEWNENIPTIFSAGLPKVSAESAFIESMTTWKQDKKSNTVKPATKWIKKVDESMWRNFGQYVRVDQEENSYKPGIVNWLNLLKDKEILPKNKILNLATVGLVSDGNATSQSPAVEVQDNMKIEAGVLFDSKEGSIRWPRLIEDEIEMTKQIVSYYRSFTFSVGKLRNLEDPKGFANKCSGVLYNQLNEPFLLWLESLKNSDNPNEKEKVWRKKLQQIVFKEANEFFYEASPCDIQGLVKNKKANNIFTEYKKFKILVLSKLKKGAK